MSDATRGTEHNEGRRKLFGCLGGLGILLVVFGVLYYVTQVPTKRVEEIVELLDNLRHERPDSVSPENWEGVVNLTKKLHDKCNIFYKMPTPEVLKFKRRLQDRIKLHRVSADTIYKIWDMYAEISREGKRYVAIWYPDLKDKLGVDPESADANVEDDLEAPMIGDEEGNSIEDDDAEGN